MQWSKKLTSILSNESKMPASYDEDLDLLRVLKLSLSILHKKTGARNIIWFARDEYNRWHEAAHQIQQLEQDQTYFQECRILGFNPFQTFELQNIIKEFKSRSCESQVVIYNNQGMALIPVTHPKTKEIFGLFLIIDINKEEVSEVASNCIKIICGFSKHLAFCFEHWLVKSESYHDDLTGLYNQKYLTMIIDNEIHRSSRTKGKFSVLFMDVDYFKTVNDTKGHLVGSKILVELGQVLQFNLRRSDYAFRYGGDEFVIVLPETMAEGAAIVAERLRAKVEANKFLIDGDEIKVTLSVGIATYPDHAKNRKEIIQMADKAMYEGKAKSRNIVIMAS